MNFSFGCGNGILFSISIEVMAWMVLYNVNVE